MRRDLVRSTVVAVMSAVLLVGVPITALAIWLRARWSAGRGTADQGLERDLVMIIGLLIVLSAVAVLVAVVLAARQAQRLGKPMGELADRAERFGAGESRYTPMHSGIAEIDRVSQVIERSARSLTRNLAAEREFASDASHQLRTPLTALLMRLEEISSTDDLTIAREEATIAIAQVERLTGVVDDLLSRARRPPTDEERSVPLDSVIATLQREWQPAFAQARRSIKVSGERGLRVTATSAALSQVISTLLENSLAHGRGTVSMDARHSGPSVVLEVSDQGKGVDPELAPHIFERSVSSGSSTGLGLALARDLAEAQGGRLELIQAQPVIFALFLSEAEAGTTSVVLPTSAVRPEGASCGPLRLG